MDESGLRQRGIIVIVIRNENRALRWAFAVHTTPWKQVLCEVLERGPVLILHTMTPGYIVHHFRPMWRNWQTR
jgi:hypothetical protein